MKALLRIAAVLLAAILATSATGPLGDRGVAAAQTPKEQKAMTVAKSFVDDAFSALTVKGASDADRFNKLEGVIAGAFAFDAWEKFILGSKAKTFSSEQIESFRGLLPRYMARLYERQLGAGQTKAPSIEGARTVRRDVFVKAVIPRGSRMPLPVEWRMRDLKGRGPKVLDIVVGGISFLILKREEFRALLAKDGPDSLLQHMRSFANGQPT